MSESGTSRRSLLRRGLLGLGLGVASTYLAWAPESWPGSRRDRTGRRSRPRSRPLRLPDFRVAPPTSAAEIGIGRGETARARLLGALEALGGLEHYVRPGDIVLVKPNVAFDRAPLLGATTDPEILEALVRHLLADCRAQEVRVTDNPIESPSDCFAKTGIAGATAAAGGRVLLPDGNAFRQLHTPGARLIEKWDFLYRPLTNVDKVIGIAPVKDHNLCGASLGIKNWYGLLGGRRNQFHQEIHRIIADLALMMRPTLSILDGGRVLMRGGPTGGDPTQVKAGDTVVASVDPVAADAWAFQHLLERGTDFPAYLNLAQTQGSGRLDVQGRIREVRG